MHTDPEFLVAAILGFPDGERIPADLMIDMVGRVAAAVDLPVTADLEAGYGDPGETVRKAIGVGVVAAFGAHPPVRPRRRPCSAVARCPTGSCRSPDRGNALVTRR